MEGEEGFAIASCSQFESLDLSDPTSLYYLMLAVLFLNVGLAWRISVSRFGITLKASRTNQIRLATLGYTVLPYSFSST